MSADQEISITGETHYFDDLRPRLLGLRRKDPSCSIAEQAVDYFRIIEAGPYGHVTHVDKDGMDPEELKSLAQELGGSPDSYFEAFCMIKARMRGKARWGEKTPRHVYRVDDILTSFPRAKIVFVVRDPRAVVASYRDWKTRGDFPEHLRQAFARDEVRARRSYHLFIISIMWRSAVRTMAALQDRYGPESIHLLRYEDLAQDPQGALTELCRFLAVPFTSEMLAVPLVNSSYSTTQEPVGISTAPLSRWRVKLSTREIAAIQARCGTLMDSFGYQPESVPRFPLWMLWQWLTLPLAVIRASVVNRSRIASLPDYIWRRMRSRALGGT